MLIDLGYVRTAAASPRMKVADIEYNTNNIINVLKKAEQDNISIVCFPELCITGYTCGDLFLQDTLLNGAIDGLKNIIDAKIKVTAIVGLPLMTDGVLYNCAAVVYDGQLLGIVPKKHIPNYK